MQKEKQTFCKIGYSLAGISSCSLYISLCKSSLSKSTKAHTGDIYIDKITGERSQPLVLQNPLLNLFATASAAVRLKEK